MTPGLLVLKLRVALGAWGKRGLLENQLWDLEVHLGRGGHEGRRVNKASVACQGKYRGTVRGGALVRLALWGSQA